MKVPELFHHLKFFEVSDYKGFSKFLKSPYHNYYLKSYSDILRIIEKNIKLLNLDKFRELRDLILKSLKCSESTTLTILSRLGDLVIEYFRIKAVECKQFEKEYLLCEYLFSIGYYRILDTKLLKCWKMVDNGEKIDEDFYLKYFQLEYLNYRYSISNNSKFLGDNSIIEQQHFTLNSTKDLFVFSLVRFTINYLNYVIQNIDSTEKNPSLYPLDMHNMFRIIKSAELKVYDKHQKSIIRLYYYLFLMFDDLNSDKAFARYRDYFYKSINTFNDNYSSTHFSILLNYCHLRQRLNDKDAKYNKEGLKIMKEYIKQKMYVDEQNKYLLPILYRNFIINCNIPSTKSILREFIDKETINLHMSHRKDMMNFGNAFYSYLNKDYRDALKLMLNLKHPKFMYKYDIRNLELKIYFDKGNYVDLNSALHNYDENRKVEPMFTISDREKYKLMINNFRTLMKIDENYKQENKILNYEYFFHQLKSSPGFIMKQWFIDKVKSIIKTHYLKYSTKNAYK